MRPARATPAITQGVRSRAAIAVPAAGAPQEGQNRALVGTPPPQAVQREPSRGDPHWEQTLPASGAPQDRQTEAAPLVIERSLLSAATIQAVLSGSTSAAANRTTPPTMSQTVRSIHHRLVGTV